MTSDKKQTLVKEIIDEMFRLSGHEIGFTDVLERKDDWYSQYTMTEAQCNEWMKWGVTLISKRLRVSKQLATREMNMLNLMFGLRIEETKPLDKAK